MPTATFQRIKMLRSVLFFTLFSLVLCRSDGPPLPDICVPAYQLIPQHMGTAPQTGAASFFIEVEDASYIAGATITSKEIGIMM